ncbi:MAG TPA: FAD-binding oxidoreductase [Longimicrobiales bacterium]|nr:FAD-binding oxidoreductase [Longimicrobiales bacterium]
MHTFLTRDGGTVDLSAEAIGTLRSVMDGPVLVPGDGDYDGERSIWNAMIDRRPGAIAQCRSADDVAAVVRFANDHGLLFTVRGAGHNIAGNAVADDVLLLDTSHMRDVQVDPGARIVRVEPGCTLGDIDARTQEVGLATPLGINSTTGIAGLTLGGGFGWMSRKHGLTIDNLVSVDLVTATGEKVRASADENPDLFWAVRGGGGNFGVVTAFELRLHPHGPEILSGLVVHPFDDAMGVLQAWRDYCATAPDGASAWVVMRKAPPLPFLPEEVHGTEVVVLAMHYTGDMAEGEAALAPLRAYGSPIADVVGPHPYVGWQQAFDPLLTPGARNYWKTHNFDGLSDEVLELLVSKVRTLPDPQCEIFLAQMGGAVARVPEDATAYVGRAADFIMNVHGRWADAGQDGAVVSWARDVFTSLEPHAMGTAYVNFMPADEGARVEGAYGGNYARLAQVKRDWDPENVFRFNQNVAPATV